MKFLIIFLISSIIIAQTTGYTETFNGPVTIQAPSSFNLVQQNGQLIAYVEKEASKLWQSIEYTLPVRIDASDSPYLNIRLKSDKATLLSIHVVDELFVQTSRDIKVYPSEHFTEYMIDFSSSTSINKEFIKKVRLSPNGNSVDAFSCELIVDEIKIGSDAEKIAGISAVQNQKVFVNSTDNRIKLLDLKNTESLEASNSGYSISDITISPIEDDFAEIIYNCTNNFVGWDTIYINAAGDEGYLDNMIKVPVEIEGNYPPGIDVINDKEAVIGDTLKISLNGINDGNITVDQPLLIQANSNNQEALPDSNIILSYQGSLSIADLYVVPVKDTNNIEITISIDDQYETDNITNISFALNTFEQFNNPPALNPLPDQFTYIEDEETLIELSGITDGDGYTQNLTIIAQSSNDSVVADSMLFIDYEIGSEYAVLTLIPNSIGITEINVAVEDDGGNEFNNGDGSGSIRFDLEVLNRPKNGHSADFKSFNNWGLDYNDGQQEYELGSFKGKENVLKITLNNKSCWTGTVYNTPELDLNNHRYLSYEIYFEGESFDIIGGGGRTHCYLYDDGWDADTDRNLPEAHNQRKFAYHGEWKTVFMDFRGKNGIENSEGENINIKRVQKVLLNYATNFTWPFPIDNGIVYISNLKIGDAVPDSLISVLETVCTIDPVSDQTVFAGKTEQKVDLSGITNGKDDSESPLVTAVLSDSTILKNVQIDEVDSEGNAALSYELTDKLGRTKVILNVSFPGSVSNSASFNVDVIDSDIRHTADIELFPDSLYQTIRGFGTFHFSGQPSYLKRYTDDLGASAVRIGIISNQIEPVNDNNDANVLNLEGFNYNAFDFEYFKRLKAGGVETFILTSWSPPAWMKRNLSVDYGYASAPYYEATDNILETYYYDEFAESMVAAVKMFKIKSGIDLYAIGIQNEPAFNEPYASAVLSPQKFAQLVSIVGKRFERDGISTKLYMPEQVFSQNHYSMSEYISALFNHPDAQDFVDIIATHSYAADGIQPGQPSFPGWKSLWGNSQKGNRPKELWMSETYPECRNWNDAISLAGAIYGALEFGNVSLWTLWNIEGTLMQTGKKLESFYTSQNYYKFIKPGARRIKSYSEHPDILVTSFSDSINSRLTSVIINKNEDPITVRVIGRKDSIPSNFDVFKSAKNKDFEYSGNIGENESLALLGKSVTTLVGDLSGDLVLPVNIESDIPKGFELSQNYPNPFNPTTTIKYSIPEAARVKLEIYNVLGQKVRTLVNGFKKPGNYTVSLNASNYASGVYFYKIKTNKFSKVKKMMLLK